MPRAVTHYKYLFKRHSRYEQYPNPFVRNLKALYDTCPEELATLRGWFWKHHRLRRLIYGLPHDYRYGEGYERLRLMSIFIGVQYLVGALIGAASLIMYWVESAARAPTYWLIAIPIASMFAGCYFLPPRRWRRSHFRPHIAPVIIYHIFLLGGGALIAFFSWELNGPLSIAESVFFIWGAAYSFTFFSQWQAAFYVALSLTAYGISLDIRHIPLIAPIVTFGVGGTFLVGISMGTVVSREWSFRSGVVRQVSQALASIQEPIQHVNALVTEWIDGQTEISISSNGFIALHRHIDTIDDDINRIISDQQFDLAIAPLAIEESQVNVQELIERWKSNHTRQLTEIDFRISCDRETGTDVYTDRDKFTRVVQILLDNAVGSEPTWVAVILTETNGTLLIQVIDDGIPYGSMEVATIFTSFGECPSGRSYLIPTAHSYARHLGADLNFRGASRTQRTIFELRIPLTHPDAHDRRSPMRIAIVGQQNDDLDLFISRLRHHGTGVTEERSLPDIAARLSVDNYLSCVVLADDVVQQYGNSPGDVVDLRQLAAHDGLRVVGLLRDDAGDDVVRDNMQVDAWVRYGDSMSHVLRALMVQE